MHIHFAVHCDSYGRAIRDNYEIDVLEGYNTWARVNDEYSKYVENLIKSKLKYDYNMLNVDVIDKDGSKLELDKMLTDENLNIDKYTVVLDNKEDKSSSQSIGVYDFDRKLVNSDNLPKVMEYYYNQWEKENDKK